MIKHISFKHGWFYHYRVNVPKLDKLSEELVPLNDFLLKMFEECPDDYFQSGPRSSKLKLDLDFDVSQHDNHVLCGFAKLGLDQARYNTAHSNVQMTMLELDDHTVAVEVPIWLHPDDISNYQDLLDSDEPLTGHIDALSIVGNNVWIWDYKPKAHKEKYAHVQTYMYALMLSKRTKIPLKNFRCGYFDEDTCYTFKPQAPELVLVN